MILYPAVDIRDGQAVRLTQGDYAREQVYDADPVDAARRWADGGAERLHLVDLDGARAGHPCNLAAVDRIVAAVSIPVQLGGGLRDQSAVATVLNAGVDRAVLGTAAQSDPDLIERLVAEHGPERIVVAVDARAGRVSVAGWREQTATTPAELVSALAERGARIFLYTPVEVDGTLEGPDLTRLDAVEAAAAEAGSRLIYSGGVGLLADLRALRRRSAAIDGVIVGRALYEGRFSVGDAIAALAP